MGPEDWRAETMWVAGREYSIAVARKPSRSNSWRTIIHARFQGAARIRFEASSDEPPQIRGPRLVVGEHVLEILPVPFRYSVDGREYLLRGSSWTVEFWNGHFMGWSTW
jgi:hypothetical protein